MLASRILQQSLSLHRLCAYQWLLARLWTPSLDDQGARLHKAIKSKLNDQDTLPSSISEQCRLASPDASLQALTSAHAGMRTCFVETSVDACEKGEYSETARRCVDSLVRGQFVKMTKGRLYNTLPSSSLQIAFMSLYGRVDAFTGGPLDLEQCSGDA